MYKRQDLDAAIAAINDAKIFRFLTKPCPSELIIESVNEALEQVRLRKAERELLDHTLTGTVSMLNDVLGVVSPTASTRTNRLHKLAESICSALGRPMGWDLSLAVKLSQLGFVVLPPNEDMRATGGADTRHAAMSADLIANIPRMGPVAEMIRHQLDPAPVSRDLSSEATLKAEILRVAVRYDAYTGSGLSHAQAVKRLADGNSPPADGILAALRAVEGHEEPTVEIDVTLAQLRTGMKLAADLVLLSGSKLAAPGTEVTTVLLGRIQAFAENTGVVEPIKVLVPASQAVKLAA